MPHTAKAPRAYHIPNLAKNMMLSAERYALAHAEPCPGQASDHHGIDPLVANVEFGPSVSTPRASLEAGPNTAG